MPFIVGVPIVTTLFIFAVVVFLAFVALMIYTCATDTTELIKFSDDISMNVVVYKPVKWRTVAQLYNLFMLLWTVGFFHAFSFTTIALCGVQWYWSQPGDNKDPPHDAIRWSMRTLIIHHLGTLALGSFLIAIVQWCRVVLRLFEGRLKKIAGDTEPVKFLLCCANCLLACFERLVKFLTSHAYVMTAMTGDSLVHGARHAMHLLLSNIQILSVNLIGDVVITLGKLAITLFVTFIGYLWLHARHTNSTTNVNDNGTTTNNFTLVLVVVALLAYFIASVFASVFNVCIDTVLLCYCYDASTNNGADRPYYFPSDLQQYVAASHARKKKKSNKEEDAATSAALLPGKTAQAQEESGGYTKLAV